MEVDIIKYIAEKIPELKNRIFPIYTTDLTKISLVYNFTPLSGGHLKESQMEIKIIHKDYNCCKEVEKKLRELLDIEDDEPFVVTGNTVFHSKIAGGGCLFNDGCQRCEDTLYFIIKWRNTYGK